MTLTVNPVKLPIIRAVAGGVEPRGMQKPEEIFHPNYGEASQGEPFSGTREMFIYQVKLFKINDFN